MPGQDDPMAPLPAGDLEHVLAHARGAWEDLRGGRIFVTGGTGVFGTWLLESFARADAALGLGARAAVLTRDPDAFRSRAPHLARLDAVEFLAGDVRDFPFPGGHFSHLIHAATTSSAHPERIDPAAMFDTIVEGTRRTLDFARGAGVGKFLFVSSGAVYGPRPSGPEPIEEDDPQGPDPMDVRSAYGEGKRAAELLVAMAGGLDGLEVKVARCFAFVGPRVPLDLHFAVGNFLRDGLAGGPIRVSGDGTPYRSYLHMADLMVWLATILASGRPGRAYNVGSDRALTIADLARKVAERFGVPVEIARSPVPGRPPSGYVPSIRRASDELGLSVRIDLDDALTRTIKYLLQAGPATSPDPALPPGRPPR